MKAADNKYLELMHADLDGEASESERAALRTYLDSNPEMRKTHDALARLADVLNQTADVEPPPDLGQQIMVALPPRRSAAKVLVKNKPWSVWFPVFKYGYAVAAGLLLGLVFGGVLFRSGSVTNTSDLYGVMSVKDHGRQDSVSSPMKIDLAGLKGTVFLKKSDSGVQVWIDLNSNQPAETVLTFDSHYAFKGFTQQTNNVREVAAGPGQVRLTFEGQNRSTLLLAPESGAPATVDFKILISGQSVYSGILRLPN